MGVKEHTLVMIILEKGFHENWRGFVGGGGGPWGLKTERYILIYIIDI